MLFIFTFVITLLVADPVEPSKRYLPSMQLSNWADSLVGWRANRGAWKLDPEQPIGPYFYRIGPDYSVSAIDTDCFALKIAGQNYGQEGKEWYTKVKFDSTGVLATEVESHNKESIPLTVVPQYLLPPYHPFYIVSYKISNPGQTEISGHLFDYVDLHQPLDGANPTTTIDVSSGHPNTLSKMGGSDDSLRFSSGLMSTAGVVGDATYFVGEAGKGKEEDPLAAFLDGDGTLPNKGESTAPSQRVGFSVPFTLKAGESVEINFFRSFRTTPVALNRAIKFLRTTEKKKIFETAETEIGRWLAKGKKPETLTKRQLNLYTNSLLMTKNAQNPTIGTITASFHHKYDHKCWTRDAFFSAFILGEAGYRDECALFFRWMGKCDMKEDTVRGFRHFACCYDFFTGRIVDFVDPQLDNMGMFMMGVYNLFLDKNTIRFVREIEPRIREVAQVLLEKKGHLDLFPSDYSIWEESSSPEDGTPYPYGYYAWTQAFAYAGMVSASKIFRDHFREPVMAEALRRRGLELNRLLIEHMVGETSTSIDTPEPKIQGIFRQIVDDKDKGYPKEDVMDASTFAFYWLGLLGTPSSTYPNVQSPIIHYPLAPIHYEHVLSCVGQKTPAGKPKRDYMGVGRYEGDLYFSTGKWSPVKDEASGPTPPWGVTTMFTLWAELSMGINAKALQRLRWMALTAAEFDLPVGEAIDHDNQFIWSSAPDLYEHGGVFIYSTLLLEGKARLMNPMAWNGDSVV